MRRIEIKLRLIENTLEAINNPRRINSRTILQNSKTKEAKALVDKIVETQKLIDELNDPTAHYMYQDALNKLEQIRQNIVFPMIYITCDNEEDMS